MTRKRRIHWLIPLGCLLAAVALVGLMGTPRLIQYAFLPGDELSSYIDRVEDVTRALDGAAEIVTLHGIKNGAPVSVDEGAAESDVALYMVGARWNEAYPRRMTDGEYLSYAAIAARDCAVVLDDKLAFKLFSDHEPVGQRVLIGGQRFEVVGVAAHTRGVGEACQYAAWIPLGSEETLGCDLMVATAVSGIDGGLMTLFGNAAKEAFGEGSLYGLMKERMRAGMILRFIALAMALRLLRVWIGVLKRVGEAWLADYRARIQTRYFRQLIGFAALRVLAMLLAAAATLAVCWGLMNFFVEPVKVFVEWVPEVLVSFASIRGRFWELAGDAARMVSLVTPELAALRFWAFVLRWGVIIALIGGVMTALKGVFPKKKPAGR